MITSGHTREDMLTIAKTNTSDTFVMHLGELCALK